MIGGLCTPLLEFVGADHDFGIPLTTSDITLQVMANKHFIKTAKPPFWWRLMGDYPFPLPNVELISPGAPADRTNWRLDTAERTRARWVAKRRFGPQPRDDNNHPDATPEEGEFEEVLEQQAQQPPHQQPLPLAGTSTGHEQGESSSRRRARPTIEERVEELHERFSSWDTQWGVMQASHAALVTRFDTFEAQYHGDQIQRRSFEEEQRAEWALATERAQQQQQMYDMLARFGGQFPPSQ